MLSCHSFTTDACGNCVRLGNTPSLSSGLEIFIVQQLTRFAHVRHVPHTMADDTPPSSSTRPVTAGHDTRTDAHDAPGQQQPGPTQAPEEADALCVRVEAFGSGVPLHDGLSVSRGATVDDLVQLVLSSVTLHPRTCTLRLFVGHGGTELSDRSLRIADSALATEQHQPLVAFPVMCTSLLPLSLGCRWRARFRVGVPSNSREHCNRAR